MDMLTNLGLGDVVSTGLNWVGMAQSLGTITNIALLVLGLLSCFLGYRLSRWVCGVAGAVIGAVLCSYVAASYLPSALSGIAAPLAAVVGALLVGYLFFHLYQAMVFVVCAGFGALLGSVPATAVGLGDGATSMIFLVIVLACAVLFGIAGVLFFKPVMIVLTGLAGFIAAPQALTLAGMSGGTVTNLLAGAVMSVIGIAVQFATNRSRTAPGFGRNGAPNGAMNAPSGGFSFGRKKRAADNAPQYGQDNAAFADGNGAPVDDSTQPVDSTANGGYTAPKADKPKRKKKPKAPKPVIDNPLLRGLVDISPILLLIALCLTVVAQTTHFELVLLISVLCYRGRQYKPMLFGYAILLLYCGYMTYAQWNMSDLPGTGFNVIGCIVFAILTIWALVCALRPIPDMLEEEFDPEDDEDATVILSDYEEELDATRPLTQEDREEAGMAEETEVIPTRTITVDNTPDDGVSDETRTFAAGAPKEFRETQKEIFDANTSAAEAEDGMAAEPDDLDGTRML